MVAKAQEMREVPLPELQQQMKIIMFVAMMRNISPYDIKDDLDNTARLVVAFRSALDPKFREGLAKKREEIKNQTLAVLGELLYGGSSDSPHSDT
jgi:hypothetical protein